ncbi:MAG TPA: DUF2141 domain-containing protein [Phenylobacterium sp.]|nr:DUF2141 domain-containing protein [Phenylobacterium sp.]
MRRSALVFLLTAAVATPAAAGDLTVTVKGVKNASGSVLGAVYDEAGFMQQPKAKAVARAKAAPGAVALTFHNLPAGRFAVAVFHDANGDGKLAKNNLGVPTEGYGFSNDAQGSAGPPRFDQAAFAFDGHAKAVAIDLDY